MDLVVRPATDAEVEFAWPLYATYISEHIHPRLAKAQQKGDWLADEAKKFRASWRHTEPFSIEIDKELIGWLAISRSNNTITIDNVFIVNKWQGKGVGSRIFSEMIPAWKKDRRLVVVPVLLDTPLTSSIQNELTMLGFKAERSDSLAVHMVAQW